MNLCNGIIFQGGVLCDNYEMIIAKYCYENDIPTLGICCGQNVIVRALGGTTFKIPNPEKQNQSSKDYVHDIKINYISKFYWIVESKRIKVNSRHKRSISTSLLLDQVAFCEDGYVDLWNQKIKKSIWVLDFILRVYIKKMKIGIIFSSILLKNPKNKRICLTI